MKLTIILIALSVIPITLLGLIAYHKTQDILTQRFQVTTKQTVSEVNRGLDKYFGKFNEELNILSPVLILRSLIHIREIRLF
ncbi:MAG: hypothetical protein LKE46_08145 [Clostridium sp.]|jgi:methyl-accepting chemotaxis protein|uniref:hypothetical protein n=1 Tax=Clostridium sp. TaxID=1506 RepID=UPI0025BE11AC|nr:hypothetical protein [Clostridium sp.]MCH3964236.1 hypothetical protein [Clostridium sp.]MCI1870610.1 hypothetical protein [Clostridium sp.]